MRFRDLAQTLPKMWSVKPDPLYDSAIVRLSMFARTYSEDSEAGEMVTLTGQAVSLSSCDEAASRGPRPFLWGGGVMCYTLEGFNSRL